MWQYAKFIRGEFQGRKIIIKSEPPRRRDLVGEEALLVMDDAIMDRLFSPGEEDPPIFRNRLVYETNVFFEKTDWNPRRTCYTEQGDVEFMVDDDAILKKRVKKREFGDWDTFGEDGIDWNF